MSTDFFWRLPTGGDGVFAWDRQTRGDWVPHQDGNIAPSRRNGENDGVQYIDYLAQVAKAAELNGFDGALVPVGPGSDETWTVTAALAREVRKLRFLIALQPVHFLPSYIAQIAATLSRISGGRIDWNIITGGNATQQRAIGDFFDHDQRYKRTGEFLDVVQGLWENENFNYEGEVYRIENGGFREPHRSARRPLNYFAGASDPAIEVAGKHADVYLVWAEPPGAQRDLIRRVREAADRHGRADKVKFGIRVDIIARETADEAWEVARKIFANLDQKTVDLGVKRYLKEGNESVGGARQYALHQGRIGRFEDLVVSPNLWAGLGLARPGGPTTGIVGSYKEVAERIAQYEDEGFSTFILASGPHLEEAYRVGQELLPLLRRRAGAQTAGALKRA